MSIDTGRERIDEGRHPRRTFERLTPAASSGQPGGLPAPSPSQESADRTRQTAGDVSGGPRVEVEQAPQGVAARPTWLRRLGYYSLALVLVAVAAALRWTFADVLSPTPFLVFYLAWVGAAAFGGLGPGLLATAASWLCVDFLFDPTPGHMGLDESMSAVRLLVFLAGGLVVSVVGEVMRRSRVRVRQQGRELAAANTTLRESEQKYRSIVETATEAIVMTDGEARTVFANARWSEIFGYSLEEARHMTHFDLVFPEDLAEMTARWESRKRGQRETYEFRLRRKDGSPVWVLIGVTPRLGPAGEFLGTLVMIADITKRKKAEESLRKSEERLRLALQGGRMGQWEWDLRTDSLFWSARIYELLGLDTFRQPRIEMFLDHVHPDDQAGVKRFLAEALNERRDLEIEFRVLRCWRERRTDLAWLAFHAMIIRDEQGQAVRMIGVLYDITPRRQMEEELRRLNDLLGGEVQAKIEELKDREVRLEVEVDRRASVEDELRERSQTLEAFFQHTITPLAFLDRDFRFVRVNEAYAKADGRSPDYFVGKNHFALYPQAENQAIFEQVVHSGQPHYAYAKPFTYPDHPEWGVTYWDWQLTPIFDGSGQVRSLVLSLVDVTERQRAFREMEQRARQLQKLTLDLAQAEERERKRLAEILHDDLQQVLAAAKFHLGVLKGRVKEDTEAQEIAVQLKELLGEALDKSRSLSHELSSAALFQSDLTEAFEFLAGQMQAKHGLKVRLDLRERIELASEPLRIMLYRAAQELLFNVAKYAGVREATLRVRRRRGRLCLSVSDKGRGFDPQGLGKASGFGLLSIRERVDLLGGRMKIRSVAGKGSTFLLTVPDANAREPALSEEAPPAEGGVSAPEE